LLAALAILALALGSAMFSGASFSSKSANSASLSAGSIQLTSSKSSSEAIVAASGMRPGESREGTITIGNKGDGAATVSLKGSGLTGTTLASVIDLTIDDTTAGTQKWSGKLSAFPAAGSVSVGSIATGSSRTYRVTLSWPSASNSASLQGTSTSLTFQWSGSWSASP
jgi:hypothetical protein